VSTHLCLLDTVLRVPWNNVARSLKHCCQLSPRDAWEPGSFRKLKENTDRRLFSLQLQQMSKFSFWLICFLTFSYPCSAIIPIVHAPAISLSRKWHREHVEKNSCSWWGEAAGLGFRVFPFGGRVGVLDFCCSQRVPMKLSLFCNKFSMGF
jgi:hypothetical protein